MKHQIIGLLNIREHRGLIGIGAREQWIMSALEILLRAELERSQKEDTRERGQLVDH